jgi:hypothetical protein
MGLSKPPRFLIAGCNIWIFSPRNLLKYGCDRRLSVQESWSRYLIINSSFWVCGVTYTVSSGAFAIVFAVGIGTARYINAYINGTQMMRAENEDDTADCASFVVPRGATYKVDANEIKEMLVG